MERTLIVTDYDGTLAGSNGVVSAQNRAMLDALGKQSHVRVIATGRNLYSVRKVIDRNFPVDFVIFTTGAGAIHWPTQKIIFSHHLDQEAIRSAYLCFQNFQIDFMIHNPIPNNHYFQFFSTGIKNLDFEYRKKHYQDYCRLGDVDSLPQEATQFVGVLRDEQPEEFYHEVKASLSGVNVVRATSPFNLRSLWIEVFAKEAAKHLSAQALANQLQIPLSRTVAVGNDYNDVELLSWAKKAYAVGNAIQPLKDIHEVVGSAEGHGFAEAMKRFFKEI